MMYAPDDSILLPWGTWMPLSALGPCRGCGAMTFSLVSRPNGRHGVECVHCCYPWRKPDGLAVIGAMDQATGEIRLGSDRRTKEAA